MHVAGNEHFLAPCPTILACVADTLNLLYTGLYKWFRRVRGPAATQATQYLLSANAMIGRVNTGLGSEVKFPLTVCCEFSLLTEPPRSREI